MKKLKRTIDQVRTALEVETARADAAEERANALDKEVTLLMKGHSKLKAMLEASLLVLDDVRESVK